MKRIIICTLLATAALTASAQESVEKSIKDRRKGFIGITLGASIPVGEYAKASQASPGARTGSSLNLVNFGYRFSDNIGIAAKWYGGANPIMLEREFEGMEKNIDPWAYGGMMAGPMVCVPVSRIIEFDFRPMIGYSVTQLPKHKNEKETTASEGALAYTLGLTAQFNVASRFGIHAGVDYFHTNAKFEFGNPGYVMKLEKKVSTISPALSFVYRFN